MTTEQIYQAKSLDYFSQCRQEIQSVIPPGPHRILELGCGVGATGLALKNSGRAARVVGVEISQEAAAEASKVLDQVLVRNLDHLDWRELAAEGPFDYILATDVLEHLIDPWAVVQCCSSLLRNGGLFIALVPNVRNLKVILPLLLKGEFTYASWGLLDKGHIRFFTKKTLHSLFSGNSFHVQNIRHQITPKSKSGRLNRMTFGLIEDFITPHYLVVAESEPPAER